MLADSLISGAPAIAVLVYSIMRVVMANSRYRIARYTIEVYDNPDLYSQDLIRLLLEMIALKIHITQV